MDRRRIRKEYQEKFNLWDAFRSKLVVLIGELTHDNSHVHSIESRIKTLESVFKKMQVLGIDDLSKIGDIIGIQIIVDDLNAVTSLNTLFEQNFNINSIEEKKWDDSPLLGAIHLNVGLRETRLELVEYRPFRGIRAEILVVTAFYHAWQQVSHIFPNIPKIEVSAPQKSITGLHFTDDLNNVIEDFEELTLQDDVHERDVHKFINNHRFILHPNPKEIWSEVAIGLGTEFRMDFVIREAIGSYILVEIENPNLPLFTRHGDFTYQANHAIGQVEEWQEWIENNLPMVQKRYPEMISPKGLVIMGRSAQLTDSLRVKISRRNINLHGSLTILTYDDLISSARAYISSLRNQFKTNE